MINNHALLAPLQNHDGFNKMCTAFQEAVPATLWASGAITAQKWHMAAGILATRRKPALIIAPSELKAKEIYENMYYFFRENCHLYPSRDMIFYAADVKSVDITRQRLRVIDKLHSGVASIVILSAEALLDRMTPPEIFHTYRMGLAVGDICEPDTAMRKLVQMGYERSSLAEGPGQFALRGGILDVYAAVGHYELPNMKWAAPTPPEGSVAGVDPQRNGGVWGSAPLLEGQALRIEFFGDEIDSIRVIDALSQRSVENAGAFEIYPMRELVFGKTRLNDAILKVRAATEAQCDALRERGLPKEAVTLQDTIDFALENWREGSHTQADAFLPFFYEEEANLLDYLPSDTIIFFDEPNPIAVHMETVQAELGESISHRLESGRLLPQQVNVMMPWQQVLHRSQKFHRVLFSSMSGQLKEFENATEICIQARTCTPLRHKPDELKHDIARYLREGYLVAILAGSRRHVELLTQNINDLDILARSAENLTDAKLVQNLITITRGTLSAGFEYPDIKLAVITDKELFATEKSKKRRRKRDKNVEKITHFADLRVGDYIVHDNHGIGIFRGIEQVTTDGLVRDYLKLEYKDGGHIYVQTAQMELIQKYIGGETEARLSKLGGADWAKAKARARKAVEILAQDLIALYAKRQAATAHVFGQDTVWQQEFEANFPYTETDDQLSAIEDVKRDMESRRVMDRLICGDVGYGKTEIAIRAAFKAVQDGKQVAYLVPTTILAQQHYATFASRLKAYPVNVDRLSRFQSKKEQTATLKNMEKGAVDIVIGTHRLLSKDINFKDLGLVIVDEEQRFGVGHKEKLKEMRNNVDVLTLTATPIPRTLHFSLTGIRDMSILDEPPEARQPVQTYVMEYNQEFVRDAINRELARGGQVYYLHNRVRNIAEECLRVQQLVPNARVSFAHGQMSETELENIMHDFVMGDIDVLVCTTIIETGLDIPNANTMIIQNADFMGLSQLYQLRGRVGRSSRLAYAYLMYRRDKVLREEAEKRLQTIREFTEFGAGFKIAMRDLEIRGAGNLLGAEQHGQMDLVGYDMYCKLLAEAVNEMKGEPMERHSEISIDISIDAHIPTRLIQDEQQKLDIYKKISLITNQQDYHDVQEEIEDRFGNLPSPVINLLDIALLKANARKLGITAISQKGLNTVITFRQNAPVDVDKLTALIVKNPTRLLFTMGDAPYITVRGFKDDPKPDDGGAWKVRQLGELLAEIM